MNVSKDNSKKTGNSGVIILLILIFAFTLTGLSCNRKVGLKPGGQVKKEKSKCKCKTKKGGIFGDFYDQNSMIKDARVSLNIDELG